MRTNIWILSIGLVSDFIGSYSRNPMAIHRSIMTALSIIGINANCHSNKKIGFALGFCRLVESDQIRSDLVSNLFTWEYEFQSCQNTFR